MSCAGSDEHLLTASVKAADDSARMKFLCSHGGKILLKPDGQLRYVGGDTRLVSFSKNVTFPDLSRKLEKMFGPNLSIKYQLPSEDLDTLISVTSDDDVENMIDEYKKNELRDGTSRLRAFLFQKNGPLRDTSRCTCQSVDLSFKGACERKSSDTVCYSQADAGDCHFDTSAVFPMADDVSGFESSCPIHGCRYHHVGSDNQVYPRHSNEDRGFVTKSGGPIALAAAHRGECSCCRSSSKQIESDGRSPALIASSLGSLVSNYNQSSIDRVKCWEEGPFANIKGDEKCQSNAHSEGYHYSQHDVLNGVSMVRVSSKDKIASGFTDVTAVDTLTRHQSMVWPDFHADIIEDSRYDGRVQGNPRHYKPPDSHWVTTEMQRAPQLGPIHGMTAGSRRESGESDEALHKAHPGADNIPKVHSILLTSEASHPVKVPDMYRHEELIVKHPLRHGEYDTAVPYCDHFHHHGRGHSQQVHWQPNDPLEQQAHPITSPDLLRVVHNNHGMQRHGQSMEYHPLPTVHHNHIMCTSSNMRTVPQSDAPSVRLPSPMYRQSVSGGALRIDLPSPRRGQVSNNGSLFTLRQGHRASQKHDISYLPSSKAQHSSGLPTDQVFANAMEQHVSYDQNVTQTHFNEKGSLANFESPAQYLDKDGSV
ncbi:hypothetical protein KP509_04G021300 [Ceratopteris richardii]|uniref:PB1 domain-containing protein n=1 Tax=Ceratopteris richardii TaxID=49495 RepID=A0A8T2UR00_CERRI|nr:hypothetical protein KP509_04G021300 [Ceratopteris richardii]KAH7438577.1 hypothetical protein KP509_04G021300 [Ceratopteris richardii]